MEWWLLLSIIVVALVALMFLGLPICFSLGFLAMVATAILWGPKGMFNFATTAYGQINSFTLTAVPLFILMADIILYSGVSDDAFDMLHKWIGSIPGGLAVASELGCTLFAAVCGASTATTATIGMIAVPEMLKRNYDKRLATGCIAAGGALGVLIPPSILMIMYGVLAEQSIGMLFIGGILPGLMLSAMFIAYILFRCLRNPSLGPPIPGITWKDRWASLWKVWAILFLAIAMIVAIYTGVCTSAEVAGVGCFLALLIGLGYRRLSWANMKKALFRCARTTCFILWILVAAMAFGYVISYLMLPQQLCAWMTSLPVSRYVILAGINLIFIVLGCIMDPGAIIMVTTPIFVPIIVALGFDPLWFGVMFVVNMELAEITPPLGLNLYIMKGIVPPEITLSDILHGALPFMILDVIGLVLIIIFPQIIMWLPSTMMG